MDALKGRVGSFTECIVTMACPVLLAVATKKVDLSKEGNAAVRNSVPWLAAISLFLCPVAFISLYVASWPKIMLGCTKLLVHASAIAQMLLAYMIYLLITMNSPGAQTWWIYLICLIISCLGVIGFRIWSLTKTTHQISVEHWEAAQELSAVVTSLLFVGLEGLALEGQISGVGKQLTPSLETPVHVAFILCLVASVCTILATVPPIDPTYVTYTASENSLPQTQNSLPQTQNSAHGDGHGQENSLPQTQISLPQTQNSAHGDGHGQQNRVRRAIHVSCLVLALFLNTVMALVIAFLMSNCSQNEASKVKYYVIFGPPFVLFVFWLYFRYGVKKGGDVEEHGELKPASLELTKVAFGACLAISLPSFRGGGGDGHLSNSTWCFIVTAATFVSFGLGWRFFSHFKENSFIWTSKAARVCTNLCLAAAAIELLCMAMHS